MQPQGFRVVTPEAVVLEVPTAGIGSRSIARLLDSAIQLFVLGLGLLLTFVAGGLLSGGGGHGGVVSLVITLTLLAVLILGYPILWEGLWRGRTPGKAALGLRVVTTDGAPIRFRHAMVRGALNLVDVFLIGPEVGVIAMLVSRNDQRLGDLAAGTIVVRERSAARPTMPTVFYPPPGWEQYAASLDVSGMAAADYEIARAFLLRAGGFKAAARSDLAARLAGTLASRMHQVPPVGVPPELWLACAAAAYQGRHGAPGGWPPFAVPVPTQRGTSDPTWGSPRPIPATWGAPSPPVAAAWGAPPPVAGTARPAQQPAAQQSGAQQPPAPQPPAEPLTPRFTPPG